jgi:hypothetical protein
MNPNQVKKFKGLKNKIATKLIFEIVIILIVSQCIQNKAIFTKNPILSHFFNFSTFFQLESKKTLRNCR